MSNLKPTLFATLSSSLLRAGLMILTFAVFYACSMQDTKLKAVESSQEPDALVRFLDTYPDIARQLMKQTVAIYFTVPNHPNISFKSSGIIVDNKTLLTASHVLDQLVVMSQGEVKSLYEHGAIIIFDAENEPVFRSDFLFDDLFSDKDGAISMTPASGLLGVVEGHHKRQPGLDFASIKLKSSSFQRVIGGPVVPLPLDLNPPVLGDRLYSFGFAKAEGRLALHTISFTADHSFSFVPGQQNFSVYSRRVDALTKGMQPGDSGGPLVVFRKKTNSLSLVGLNVGAYTGNGSQFEVFANFRHPNLQALARRQGIVLLPDEICK